MQDDTVFPAHLLPKAPTAKIIRPAEEAAWRHGFQFLAEAERLQSVERAKGYADGKAAGAKEVSALAIEIAGKVDRYLASVEGDLVKLSLEIVTRVLQDFDDADLVARIARTALADFRKAKAITVRVHPSTEYEVRRALADLLNETGEAPPPITIEADPALDRRGCILGTDLAVVDASVDVQLAAMAEAMRSRIKGAAE